LLDRLASALGEVTASQARVDALKAELASAKAKMERDSKEKNREVEKLK